MYTHRPITPATLAGISVLRGSGEETVAALVDRCQLIELEPGEHLMRRGEPNARMCVVLDGTLRIDVSDAEGAPIARLGTGETVGEMSLLAHQPASANVSAETRVLLLSLDEETFYWLIGASHAFAVHLLVRLSDRLRTNNDAVAANMALRMKFEQAALHDALTGVHSRRWMQESLPRLVQRHASSAEPFSVALLDVDHFKRFNDTFGHAAGDTVLRAVGDIIRKRLRPTDLVARFGGEEFVLIFPQTPLWGGLRAAERLREAIGAMSLSHQGVALPRITVSLGVAALSAHTDSDQLLAEADQALYRAKHLGRDQTQTFAQAIA